MSDEKLDFIDALQDVGIAFLDLYDANNELDTNFENSESYPFEKDIESTCLDMIKWVEDKEKEIRKL